jgi:tetratricopeptide (TPR) repeat protein
VIHDGLQARNPVIPRTDAAFASHLHSKYFEVDLELDGELFDLPVGHGPQEHVHLGVRDVDVESRHRLDLTPCAGSPILEQSSSRAVEKCAWPAGQPRVIVDAMVSSPSGAWSHGSVSPASQTSRRIVAELAVADERSAVDESRWRPGDLISDEHRFERQLGVGGFGSVSLVRSVLTDRCYALKTLLPELTEQPRMKTAFAIELATWIDLDAHPNVVRANFVRQVGRRLGVFVEYIDGGTLDERIARDPPMSESEISRAAREVATAIDYAHGRGLVHADVKPGNVLLTSDGTSKWTDFGLAVAAGSRNANMTVLYRSPEQARQLPLTQATDVWGFGLTVLTMLAGKCFWRDGQRVGEMLGRGDAVALRTSSPRIVDALRRCLATDVASRWPSASAAAEAMFPRTGHIAVVTAPPSWPSGTEERPVEAWLRQAFELAGRDSAAARAAYPPRRFHRLGQALADLDGFELAHSMMRGHAGGAVLASLHRDWAGALEQIGDLAAAREHAHMSLGAALESNAPPQAPGDLLLVISAIREVARLELEAGNPNAAQEFLDKSLALCEATHAAMSDSRAMTLELGRTLALAATHARLGSRFEAALDAAERAVDVCRRVLDAGNAQETFDLAMAEFERAVALQWLRRHDAAATSFRSSIELFTRAGYAHTAAGARIPYSNALRDLGREDQALSQLETAIAELRAMGFIEELVGAHHAHLTLLVRAGDWQAAIAECEQERHDFEFLVYERGHSAYGRLLLRAELQCAEILCKLGRQKEASPILDHVFEFAQRVMQFGAWGNLWRELSDAHRLAAGISLASMQRVAATIHADKAAKLSDEVRATEPTREAAMKAAQAAYTAAQLLKNIGIHARANEHVKRARAALGNSAPGPDIDALIAELAAMADSLSVRGHAPRDGRDLECDCDVTLSLVALLLEADGASALQCVERWPEHWVAKCITYIVRMFFLYDTTEALRAFGGLDAIQELAREKRIEFFFLQGLTAILRKEQSAGMKALGFARGLEPADPYVLFTFAFASLSFGGPQAERREAIRCLAERAPMHPLVDVVATLNV